MLKKSLLFMTVISLNILPSFASDDQSDEKKPFFPQNFTAGQFKELHTKMEVRDGFKIYNSNLNKDKFFKKAP